MLSAEILLVKSRTNLESRVDSAVVDPIGVSAQCVTVSVYAARDACVIQLSICVTVSVCAARDACHSTLSTCVTVCAGILITTAVS